MSDSDIFALCEEGSLDKVSNLIQQGASLSATDVDGNTPLHIAAARGHVRLTCLLVEAGADVTVVNQDQKTPMQVAAPRLRGMMKATRDIQELYKRLETRGEEGGLGEGSETKAH